jgi:hypothetical protein
MHKERKRKTWLTISYTNCDNRKGIVRCFYNGILGFSHVGNLAKRKMSLFATFFYFFFFSFLSDTYRTISNNNQNVIGFRRPHNVDSFADERGERGRPAEDEEGCDVGVCL